MNGEAIAATMSRAQAAAYIGVCVKTLDNHVKRGLFRAVRVGRRVLFLIADLDKFLSGRNEESTNTGRADESAAVAVLAASTASTVADSQSVRVSDQAGFPPGAVGPRPVALKDRFKKRRR